MPDLTSPLDACYIDLAPWDCELAPSPCHRWDSLEVVASLTEADLLSLGVRGGHARKMMLRLPKYL